MKNAKILLAILTTVLILSLTLASCSGGGGGGGATFSVSWNPANIYHTNNYLEFVTGSITPSEEKKIFDSIKIPDDIIMDPSDVIRLDNKWDNPISSNLFINCTILKSGSVKISLRTIAGYKLTKASWGKDIITVTEP